MSLWVHPLSFVTPFNPLLVVLMFWIALGAFIVWSVLRLLRAIERLAAAKERENELRARELESRAHSETH